MTCRNIVITGEPGLHQVTNPVPQIDDQTRELVSDMFETMDKAPGVGLAANQVAANFQIFVYNWEDTQLYRGVIINPSLELLLPPSFSEDLEDDYEGCLSIPGYRYPVARSQKVLLRGIDLETKPVEIQAEGWLARIFQHEFDHLQGLTYVDRLEKISRKMIAAEIEAEGWGVPGKSWEIGKDFLEP